MEKRLYWLKLKEQFFQDKAMKKLRRMAGGDTYTIIYLKLLLLGLRAGGNLYYDRIEDTFAEELALEMDEDAENVQFCLIYLQKIGLIETVSDNQLFLTETPELTQSEAQSTIRSRRCRQKKALQSGANAAMLQQSCNADAAHLQRSANASAAPEKETETEKESETEPEAEGETERAGAGAPPPDPAAVVRDYNSICTALPPCRTLSEARKRAISARLQTYSASELHKMFEKAQASSFLTGQNKRGWSATFDWLMKDENIAKVLDGNYDDPHQASNALAEWEKEWLAEFHAMRETDGQEQPDV